MRLLAAVVLVATGAVTGLAAVALHARWWGLLLATAATVTALMALPPGWWSRLAFGLGWTGFVGWILNPRPEGDYAIAQDLAGYALLGLGMVVLVLALATLPRPGAGRRGVP